MRRIHGEGELPEVDFGLTWLRQCCSKIASSKRVPRPIVSQAQGRFSSSGTASAGSPFVERDTTQLLRPWGSTQRAEDGGGGDSRNGINQGLKTRSKTNTKPMNIFGCCSVGRGKLSCRRKKRTGCAGQNGPKGGRVMGDSAVRIVLIEANFARECGVCYVITDANY